MYTETSSKIAEGTGRGMWSFQYKHGDRPLDGYTIQRAAGRGGFGEVYYAVSDAGREVALKVITGFEQIELRGISQCMNLKSPHLVTIFDVKQNAEGRSFVIMEFVSGLNLRELMDQSPSGLGTQKAAFFLREIAKGLSYLHDCGIVHRDLKPANIFYENGYVKIGDYGLSKAIAPTHHSGQTVTVGTVHYMAPEVGCGKYDRSIDIYALGALLYEMLTGVVPFVGASAGEILIKHLSHDADCTGIPEPFCSAIKKAMAKDPANRYATVQELVEAIFGSEHVRTSVSQFAPQELSMIAERVAQRISTPMPKTVTPPPIIANTSSSVTAPNGLGTPGGAWAAGYVAGTAMLAGRKISNSILGPFADSKPTVDPFTLGQRIGLAAIAAVIIATCGMIFSGSRREPETWGFTLFAIVGGAMAIAIVGRKWLPWRREEHRWTDRFALGGTGAIAAMLAASPVWINETEQGRWAGGMFLVLLVALMLANPRRWVQTDRRERMGFKWAAAAGAIAFGFAAMFDRECNPAVAIAIAGGIALVVQVLTPWDAKAAAVRADKDDDDNDKDERGDAKTRYTQPAASPAMAGAMPSLAPIPAIPAWPFPPIRPTAPTARMRLNRMPVPRGMLIFWFCLMLLAFAIGIGFAVATIVNTRRDPSFGETMAAAISCFAISIWAMVRLFHRTYTSLWLYLVMPIARLGCVIAVIIVWANLAFSNMRFADQRDYMQVGAFFTVFWVLLWMVPLLWRMAIPPAVAVSAPIAAPVDAAALNPARASDATAPADSAIPPAVPTASTHTATPLPSLAASVVRSAWARRPVVQDKVGAMARLVGGIVLVLAWACMFAVAIDVPGMVEAGLPDRYLRSHIASDIFNNAVPDWPTFVRSVVKPVGAVLCFFGGGCLLVARRNAGLLHILRALLAVFGLVLALLPLQMEFVMKRPWQRFAELPATSQSGWRATQMVADSIGSGAFSCAMILTTALIVLAWPKRNAAVGTRTEVAK